jgi:DNA polymerase III alpha subunit
LSNYINYHSHSSASNPITPDSIISNIDRGNRCLGLGQTVLSGVEHGCALKFIEIYEFAKANNLKPLMGSEIYFVPDRTEKDKTNAHLIILAKNEIGRKSINKLLSFANTSGYYYKARTDFDLLFQIDPSSVWLTTACLGGIWKYNEQSEEILQKLYNHFGNNLFLEVQAHPVDRQIELNQKILGLSAQYGIRIIAGMDSHMIYPSQAKERDNYLLSRGIEYPDEEHWYMDYPDYNDAFKRFQRQGVLNDNQIKDALSNTLCFEDVEEYNSSIFDNSTIKLPTLFPNKNQFEKDTILSELVWKKWDEEKINVPVGIHDNYVSEIQKELDVIQKTKMADYFLLDYEIIKLGVANSGKITLTGRGSAPSFYVMKLLGFTTVDRISATVKLFPERFISAERLLETKSLPDIDFNLANPEVFAKAQSEIMGDGHSYQMIAFGTVKTLGAWKIYARVAGVDFDTANEISDKLKAYEHDLGKAETEEEKEEINIIDYIGKEHLDTYQGSLKYLGVVNSLTSHPCGYLLSNLNLIEEFGLIKIKTGNVEHICVCCDGLQAEQYKFLKNDLLKVSVVDLIYGIYERIGIAPHTLPELIKLCENDQKVWDVYANGWTDGVNQFEQHGTSSRAVKYKPRNLSELSAFVAAIRPGFKSYYNQFETREPFQYGVPTLDALIQTKEFPFSFMLYQENAMQVMAFAGIPIAETYDVIKNIAKKRPEKVFKYKRQFLKGMRDRLVDAESISDEEATKIATRTWQVIEDSSRYSFNCSHAYSVAGDSLYGAYLKSHYPLEFYEIFLRLLEADGDKDRLSIARVESEQAYGIKFPKMKFRQDNRQIVGDKETNIITTSMKTIKGFGDAIGENMYQLGTMFASDGNFVDLLIYAEENNYVSKKWETLIKIGYFSEFGKNKKLLLMFEEFVGGKFRYNKKLTDKSKDKRVPELKSIFENLPDESIGFYEQIQTDIEIFGYIQSTFKVNNHYAYVMEINEKYAPRLQVYSLAKGTQVSLKVQKRLFEQNIIRGGDVIYCDKFEKKPTVKMFDGKFVEIPNDYTWWLTQYHIIETFDNIKDKNG